MDSITFFPGSARRVIIGPPTLLVGKNKTRKIRLPLTMPLSGESVVSMPDWLSEAYEAVVQCANHLTPEIEQIADVPLTFHNPTSEAGGVLFETPDAKAPGTELKKFVILRMGNAEEPEVNLKFVCYAAYSRDLWRYLGEMAGETVQIKFPSSKQGLVEVVAAPEQPTLLDDGVTAAEEEAFAGDGKPEDGPGSDEFEQQVRESLGAPEPLSEAPRMVGNSDREPSRRKSGPSELKAYHNQEVEKEEKKRGRNLATVN